MMVSYGPWLADQPDLNNPGLVDAVNCYARTMQSYGPWKALQEVGNALTDRCQGGGSFRGIGGTVFVTAGDETNLYAWNGATWSDVSGATYATTEEDGWSFTQCGDLVIVTNGTDPAQKWEIGASIAYANLGGSPPVARFCTTVRDFVFLGRIVGAQNKVVWCAINNAESWTAGVNQSDEQSIPDGGRVMGMAGGEIGVVWTERAIHRFTYRGGALVFQRDKITDRIGCCAENSIATYEQTSFFLDFDGFYSIQSGELISRISNQQIDEFFKADVNQAFYHRVNGTVDPVRKLYIVAYPSNNSTDGTPDRLLTYNFGLPEPRWTRIEMEVDYLLTFLSNQGYHTDNVDTVITNTDATMYLVDSAQFLGSGQALLAAFSTDKKLATFEGTTLEPLIETQEIQIVPGKRTHLREVWPYADGGTNSIAIGWRNLPTESVTWDAYVSSGSGGFCPVDRDARFLRMRHKIDAGGTWDHLMGADFVARKSSMY